jgi:hypothetical protein
MDLTNYFVINLQHLISILVYYYYMYINFIILIIIKMLNYKLVVDS